MKINLNKDSVLTRFMKTNEKNQIIGEYNKTTHSYTGQLDGWKVTKSLVGGLAVSAGLVILLVGIVGFGAIGGGFGLGLSASFGAAFTAVTGMTFTPISAVGMVGGGAMLAIIGGIIFPEMPQPTEFQIQDEDECRKAEQLKRDLAEAQRIKGLLQLLPTKE